MSLESTDERSSCTDETLRRRQCFTAAGPQVGRIPWFLAILWIAAAGCSDRSHQERVSNATTSNAPSILLITLDTARADAFGFDRPFDDTSEGGSQGRPTVTPVLDALAIQSVRFSAAYATAPMTLPSHTSLFTGQYPARHGIHENARNVDGAQVLVAEHLQSAGYETAAVISALPLAGRFGIGAGFNYYDDELDGRVERSGVETTDVALSVLRRRAQGGSQSPLFLWVHYFDPHAPYSPSTPLLADANDTRVLGQLGPDVSSRYLGEIALVDREVGRLLDEFDRTVSNARVIVVGDHGESLGEYGERTHGNLLHPAVLRVPLLVRGDPEHPPGSTSATPTSIRRVFGTILTWAGVRPRGLTPQDQATLFDAPEPVVMAEAMQPYLQYGWRPQIAGLDTTTDQAGLFTVLEGSPESGATLTTIDLAERAIDPEAHPSPTLREALRAYLLPVRNGSSDSSPQLSQETRTQLASLGYVTGTSAPRRSQAPRPFLMTHLFDHLDRASVAFENADYRSAISELEAILAADPENFAAALRLAVAHSAIGNGSAEHYFDLARALAPDSTDLRHFEGMHLLQASRFNEAAALFDSVLAIEPQRAVSLNGLYHARSRAGQLPQAAAALRALVVIAPTPQRLTELGRMHMAQGETIEAIEAFERSQASDPDGFDAHLDLGVLYLATRRFQEARTALDSAIEISSAATDERRGALPMALFKRAQVSVLLNEPNAPQRVHDAVQSADPTTRRLIQSERLFEGHLR